MGKRPTLREEVLSLDVDDHLYNVICDVWPHLRRVVKMKKEWGHEYVLYLTDNRMLGLLCHKAGGISSFLSRRIP